MAVLGIGRMAIWRTQAAYLEGVREETLPVWRGGRGAGFGFGRLHAPEGDRCWTLALLKRAMRALKSVEPISRETIRRSQKKRHQTLAQIDGVCRSVSAS
jgi:hypothetical protein